MDKLLGETKNLTIHNGQVLGQAELQNQAPRIVFGSLFSLPSSTSLLSAGRHFLLRPAKASAAAPLCALKQTTIASRWLTSDKIMTASSDAGLCWIARGSTSFGVFHRSLLHYVN
ncbi:hypothetical protein GOP47_0016622 [Adiantum capillus-veneris]|uniref:Uncharacterized protein n=1 Tax=Adiantum capillus-veneris TaxID=13818 RepID=A0A9D4UIP0_ADICA|nr:hypothetical protein GOP47_0016622 [Adiantum capillus-veneris]